MFAAKKNFSLAASENMKQSFLNINSDKTLNTLAN